MGAIEDIQYVFENIIHYLILVIYIMNYSENIDITCPAYNYD